MIVLSALLLLLLVTPVVAAGPNWAKSNYVCEEIGESMLGWDPQTKRWTMNAGPPTRPWRIMLSALHSNASLVTGDGVLADNGGVHLQLVDRLDDRVRMIERTGNGNINIWTLFAPDPQLGTTTATLMQGKVYELFGPVAATTVWSCK